MNNPLIPASTPMHAGQPALEGAPGGGDNALLAALQRLCTAEALAPENTVFVSDSGGSSGLSHAMKTYGLHALQGRAMPVAVGIKLSRPELNVFVCTGDNDCCGIGAAHGIQAQRDNMDLTVIVLHDHGDGLTRQQALPINPLTVSLGAQGASFVAQAVDWIPELLFDILRAAYRHRGLSLVRVLQRVGASTVGSFDPWLHDPQRIRLLTHADGVAPSPALAGRYRNQRVHDPADLQRAREIAAQVDAIPVGVLYRNPTAPCFEDLRDAAALRSPASIRAGFEHALDRYAIVPGREPT